MSSFFGPLLSLVSIKRESPEVHPILEQSPPRRAPAINDDAKPVSDSKVLGKRKRSERTQTATSSQYACCQRESTRITRATSNLSTVSTLVEDCAVIRIKQEDSDCTIVKVKRVKREDCGRWHQEEVGRNQVAKFAVLPTWLQPCGCVNDDFANFVKPYEHTAIGSCHAGCVCAGGSISCPCAESKTTCDLDCDCPSTCMRKFPACECKGVCGRSCSCALFNRDCGPQCRCTVCGNKTGDESRPLLRIQPSRIQGAGQGLFAGAWLDAGRIIGEYTGKAVRMADIEQQEDLIQEFRISKYMALRPDITTSILFKMNHSRARKNMAFFHKKTRIGWQVFAYSLTTIQPGSELLVDYGFDPKFETTDVSPLPARLDPEFHVMLKNGHDYNIAEVAQWHRLKSFDKYRIKDTTFKVNQNILVLHGTKALSQPKSNETDKQYLSRMLKACWVARILEIRARAQNNEEEDPYFVVIWYDSKGNGILKFHGTHELDIIRGSSIAAPVDVNFVPPGRKPTKKQLIYYQEINVTQGKTRTINPTKDCWLAPPRISTRV